jgi:pimeloyl-ACP methyl ester carboxylesterase
MDGNPGSPIRLAFAEAGDGPPLLLLAGLGCDRDFWAGHLPLLAGRVRAIAPDNRGSGESAAGPGPYSAREMAGDALALLDELGVDRVDVVGHSLGGMIALEMALAAPSRVRSLALAATAARAHPRTAACLEVAAGLWERGCAPELLVKTFLTWTTSGRCLADEEFVRRAVDGSSRLGCLNRSRRGRPAPPSPASTRGGVSAGSAVRRSSPRGRDVLFRWPSPRARGGIEGARWR